MVIFDHHPESVFGDNHGVHFQGRGDRNSSYNLNFSFLFVY